MPGDCDFEDRYDFEAAGGTRGESDMFDLMEQGVGGSAISTVMIEIPESRHQKCSVKRVREHNGSIVFHMFTQGGEHLLTARSTGEKVHGKVVLSFSQFQQKSQHCLAELRPTENGSYSIQYQSSGERPDSPEELQPDSPTPRDESAELQDRSLGLIQHDNINNTPLYSMRVAVPDLNSWCPRTGFPKAQKESGCYAVKTKLPAWNEEMQSYTLDYGGRARMASAKNFQLEMADGSDPSPKGKAGRGKSSRALKGVVMQFGKYDDDTFSLDYAFPLCGLQAFAIALSTSNWR